MTKQPIKQWLCAVMILIPLWYAGAQVPAETQADAGVSAKVPVQWSLSHAEGDILLTRNGRRTALQGGSARAQGILLGAKDMVQTGKGRAELRLRAAGVPGGAQEAGTVTLNLSENTLVVLDSLDGSIVLDLLYGRIAAQSDTALGIRAGSSAAFFSECDAVIEYAARPGITQPSLVIRCLEGEGELTANAEAETGGTKYPINRAEQLSLEYRVPFVYVSRERLESAAIAEAPVISPALPLPSSVPARTGNIRKGNIVVGIVLVGAGAALQSYAYFSKQGYRFLSEPGAELRDRLFYSGYASLGLGTVFLLGGLLDKTPSSAD